MRQLIVILLLLILASRVVAGEIVDTYQMDKKLVNVMIVMIREVIAVFIEVLKTDVNEDLKDQIRTSIIVCERVLRSLEK